MKKIYWKKTWLLFILGIIGILLSIPYQLELMQANEFYQSEQAWPPHITMTINVIQQTIFLFLFVLIGVRLSESVHLHTPLIDNWIKNKKRAVFSKKWGGIALSGSLLLSILIIVLESVVFSPLLIEGGENIQIAPWQGIMASFYGGITEELIYRLFGVSLLVWIFMKLSKNKILKSSFYVTAIILISIFFGISHLPLADGLADNMSSLMLIRIVLLNGLASAWFGYLFWKKGLEYAIIAHVFFDFILLGIAAPIIY